MSAIDLPGLNLPWQLHLPLAADCVVAQLVHPAVVGVLVAAAGVAAAVAEAIVPESGQIPPGNRVRFPIGSSLGGSGSSCHLLAPL